MNIQARRQARQFAIQAIYAWQVSADPINDILAYFLSGEELDDESGLCFDAKKIDKNYFQEVVLGVAAHAKELDVMMAPHLSREDINLMERAILRLALFEITKLLNVPYKVVMNEAIELAKVLAAEDSFKFINGVLDKAISKERKKLG